MSSPNQPLAGRVAIITGAASGLGRAYALEFVSQGAKVVVNDVGRSIDGTGKDFAKALELVEEIKASGGDAIADSSDVTVWGEAEALIKHAINEFGRLDILVNNAGILRDRAIVNMSEREWDDVMSVHLKGHFLILHFAAQYWRDQHKAGVEISPSVINTSSTSGLEGNVGQSNYGAAKAGIAAFSHIAAMELEHYGVRVNCIVPNARTRLTLSQPGLDELVLPPTIEGEFDIWDPANVAAVVAWLASPDCTAHDQTMFVHGGLVQTCEPWRRGNRIEKQGRWTAEELAAKGPSLFI